MLELLFQLVLLGHVAQREHQAADAAFAAQVAAPDLDLNARAVTAGDPHFLVVRPATRVRTHPRQRAGEVITVTVGDQVPEMDALHDDVAEDAGGRRSRVPDHPVIPDDQDRVRGVLDQGAEVGLAAPADDLVAEHDPLDRQRSLLSQDFQGRGQVGQVRCPANTARTAMSGSPDGRSGSVIGQSRIPSQPGSRTLAGSPRLAAGRKSGCAPVSSGTQVSISPATRLSRAESADRRPRRGAYRHGAPRAGPRVASRGRSGRPPHP